MGNAEEGAIDADTDEASGEAMSRETKDFACAARAWAQYVAVHGQAALPRSILGTLRLACGPISERHIRLALMGAACRYNVPGEAVDAVIGQLIGR
jgi:hypothetical protein